MTDPIIIQTPAAAPLTNEQKLRLLLAEAKELLSGSKTIIEQERAEKASLRSELFTVIIQRDGLAKQKEVMVGQITQLSQIAAANFVALERIPRWVRWLFRAL